MKKNWFWRMACIVVVGILLTLVFTAYMERQESEYVYEKIEKMIPGERELLKYGLEDEGLFYVPEVIGMSGLILLVCGAMIFECVQYKKEQNQRIEELERYCERILEGKEMCIRDSIKVVVPDEYTGDVMGDLNKRRGRVLGMNPLAGGKQEIEADIPMTGVFGYCTTLRSMTGGRGTYSYEFVRYEQAPSDVQEKEIAARAAEE